MYTIINFTEKMYWIKYIFIIIQNYYKNIKITEYDNLF